MKRKAMLLALCALGITSLAADARAAKVKILGVRGKAMPFSVRGAEGARVRAEIVRTVEQHLGGPLNANQRVIFNVTRVALSYASPGATLGTVSVVTPTGDTDKRGLPTYSRKALGELTISKRGVTQPLQVLLTPKPKRVRKPRVKPAQTLSTLSIRGFHPAQIAAIQAKIQPELSPINSMSNIGSLKRSKNPDGSRTLQITVGAYNRDITYVARAARGKAFDLQGAKVSVREHTADEGLAFGLPTAFSVPGN